MRAAHVVLGVVMLTATGASSNARQQDTSPPQWRSFSGTWSAAGRRQTLRTEGPRSAAIVELSGAVMLTTAVGFSRGFRAEAIGFDDGNQVATGRAVWTDTRGDLVFSVLKGEPLATGRRVIGAITGGTGRYAGIAGDWQLTWQFVVETDDGSVQGRASDLTGRVRLAGATP